MSDINWPHVIGAVSILIFSLSFHEAAHALVASWLGDDTGKSQGRISLNPLVHIDWMITVILPAVMLILTGFIFGGAKPVPVDLKKLKHPTRDFMLIAMAGPASNVLLGFGLIVLLQILVATGGLEHPRSLSWGWLAAGIQLNFILAFFNMIPCPPLDGSRLLAWLLPGPLRVWFQKLDRLGFLIIIVLLCTGALTFLLQDYFFPFYDAYIRELLP